MEKPKSNGEEHTPEADAGTTLIPKPKAMFGTRHVVTAMLFLGLGNAYTMRVNMSIAIVAMINHTALMSSKKKELASTALDLYNCINLLNTTIYTESNQDGPYTWSSTLQGTILSSFFYGYVSLQIPFGVLVKKYGAVRILGWGMMMNSVFGILVPYAASQGPYWLILVRFLQGLGESPIVPCVHAMLAKWIPPNEMSRMGALVYSGAQFGTIIAMPVSGYLAQSTIAGGWPSIFYLFGIVGIVWSIVFLCFVSESPETCPNIAEDEKEYILRNIWGKGEISSPPFPWKRSAMSLPFWGILIAHIGQNYGYETLMTQLPLFMKQVLHFSIKDNGLVSALPYFAMLILSIVISSGADWLISKNYRSTHVRKICNSIGQYGLAIGLVIASYTGCNPTLTIVVLTIGIGLNSGTYSGFKVNHLDISPRYAGILMAITNCVANVVGLCAPIIAGYIMEGGPTKANWQKVFFVASFAFFVCGTAFNFLASGERQPWDDPAMDEAIALKKLEKKAKKEAEKPEEA